MEDSPIRADYRFMQELLTTSFASAGVSPTPKDLDLVARVFQQAGGSWVRVFKGSAKDVSLLKKTLKTAIAGGRLTRASKWGG